MSFKFVSGVKYGSRLACPSGAHRQPAGQERLDSPHLHRGPQGCGPLGACATPAPPDRRGLGGLQPCTPYPGSAAGVRALHVLGLPVEAGGGGRRWACPPPTCLLPPTAGPHRGPFVSHAGRLRDSQEKREECIVFQESV